jgi:long-subunit acyl-CoA synthetase (AMP-forming)
VLLEARPTFLFGSPRIWQGLKVALETSLDAEERAALDAGIDRVRVLAAGSSAAQLTPRQENVLRTLRARIGLDRMTRALTAAAPCPLAVHEHYHGLGVPFYEFYGMTESFGAMTVTRPGTADWGTVGGVCPGYELRLAADGEVEGRPLFASKAFRYRNRPEESAATFSPDGWIRSGDIGELDDEGRLRIVDRKKEMIVPEHGHNCPPAPIESELKSACALIGQVCVVGDGRPHLAALVVADPPERADDELARAEIAAAIEQVNATLDPRERIEAHVVIGDAWLPGAELTETLKLRRAQIAEHYAETIERLYD